VGEVIRYLTPFWGWSQDPVNATILKIDDEDEIPLKLDTSDVLEPTHKVTRVKKYVNGVLEKCPGEESMKIGEFQLENGQWSRERLSQKKITRGTTATKHSTGIHRKLGKGCQTIWFARRPVLQHNV
jgi:hypothetical protein